MTSSLPSPGGNSVPRGEVEVIAEYVPRCDCGWEGEGDFESMEHAETVLESHQREVHGGTNFRSYV